jgi:polysaccharide chain length determinant protein (PEP-CTERM system associated)
MAAPFSERFEGALNAVESVWRFKWQALATAWAACVVGWAIALSIPPSYETSARVFVDANSLLRPLLQGLAVPPNTAGQVELVRQALLARPQLERVIDSTPLKDRVSTPRQREQLVQSLATDIAIKAKVQGNPNRENVSTMYTISYRDGSPDISYTVVTGLLESFVSQSLGANESSSSMAQRFLVDQLREYERRLSDSERQLAEFKRQNVGAMPDERGGFFSRLQAEMVEVDRLQAALAVAVSKQEELRSKLLGGASSGSTQSASTAGVETSVDGRLLEARTQLEQLLLRFTESHPDVLAMQDTIARLEEQRAAEIAAIRRNSGALGAPRGGATSLVAQNLQIALNQTELEVSALRAQLADRQGRVSQLRRMINTLPEVEAELARLTRDYDVTKTQYDALLQRLESAKLSGQADREDDFRIRVIEPPVRPLTPAAPKIFYLLTGVLLAGLGVGLGLAFLRSKLHPVYQSVRQLSSATGLTVLGAVNLVQGPKEASRNRLDAALVSAGVALLVVAFGVIVLLAPTLQGVASELRIQVASL